MVNCSDPLQTFFKNALRCINTCLDVTMYIWHTLLVVCNLKHKWYKWQHIWGRGLRNSKIWSSIESINLKIFLGRKRLICSSQFQTFWTFSTSCWKINFWKFCNIKRYHFWGIFQTSEFSKMNFSAWSWKISEILNCELQTKFFLPKKILKLIALI